MKAILLTISLAALVPGVAIAQDGANAQLEAFATVTKAESPIQFSSPTNGSFGTVFQAGLPNVTCTYVVAPNGNVVAIESGDSGDPVSGFADRTRSGCGFNSTAQVPTLDVSCASGSLASYVVTPVGSGISGMEFKLNGITVDDTDPEFNQGPEFGSTGVFGFNFPCDGADQTMRIGMRLDVLDSFYELDYEVNVGQILVTANFE